MIGYNLITHQTPPQGLPVHKVLVHEGVDIDHQIYLAFLHDRKSQGPAFVVSKKGGMEIEEVAEKEPDAIKVFPIDYNKGLTEKQAAKIADFLGLKEGLHTQAIDQLKKLYKMALDLDASQIEINPWAITP